MNFLVRARVASFVGSPVTLHPGCELLQAKVPLWLGPMTWDLFVTCPSHPARRSLFQMSRIAGFLRFQNGSGDLVVDNADTIRTSVLLARWSPVCGDPEWKKCGKGGGLDPRDNDRVREFFDRDAVQIRTGYLSQRRKLSIFWTIAMKMGAFCASIRPSPWNLLWWPNSKLRARLSSQTCL